jgi:hypothetical protein
VRKDALQATQDRRHMFASTSANSTPSLPLQSLDLKPQQPHIRTC